MALNRQRPKPASAFVRAAKYALRIVGASQPQRCRPDQRKTRVLILTAEVGEGHVSAARALSAGIAAESAAVDVAIGDALGGLGRFLRLVLRDAYRWQLGRAPWVFGLLYGLFSRFAPARGLGRAGLALFGSRPLLRLIRDAKPDVVVSTFPAATSVLGYLRRRGSLTIPACATITDLAGVSFWAHPGIDMHLVMHDSCVAAVERVAGPGSARRVWPLVASEFLDSRTRPDARRALGLPLEGRTVVVSGGGWGVGDLEGAVEAALAVPGTSVVCLTGRNGRAREQLACVFASEDRVSVLGFTEHMGDLLAAADVLVHSTGGVTCLEAIVRGCPIVAYGAPPGHARLTARVMASFGLLEYARSPAELPAALLRTLEQSPERPRLAPAPSAASIVLAATTTTRRPLQATWRRRALRPAAVVSAMLVMGGWTFSTDAAYPFVTRTLETRPLTTVRTAMPQVGLVLRAPASAIRILAAVLERANAGASFAFENAPDRRTRAGVRGVRVEFLPELGAGELADWLETKHLLRERARALGVSGRFFYLAPRSGFTVGQFLLARDLGGLPVTGSAWVGPGRTGGTARLRAGQIVVLNLPSQPSAATTLLRRLLATVKRERLSVVSVDELVASAPRER